MLSMTTENMSDSNEQETAKQPEGAAAEAPGTAAEADGKKKKSGRKDGAGNQHEEALDKLQAEVEEQKDKYLRLFAEFENFRRRTARERIELVKTAGQDIMAELLTVLDDFERAEKAMAESDDIQAAREGFRLIREKLFKKLESKGLTAMDSLGKDFDPDLHEAVTEIPVPEEDRKGKVVDVLEKGYSLGEKIIRYAKVVVGK